MKKVSKIVSVLLVVLMLVALTTSVFAEFKPGDVNPDTAKTEAIQKAGNSVVGILQVIGIIAAVAVLIVLGIKYMMGSAEEKAEYKKTMIPYLIGAVLIFAASALAQTIYDWAQTFKA